MTETTLLQGEITENPHEQELDVEGLLLRFIRALVAEQSAPDAEGKIHVVPRTVSVPAEIAASERAAAQAAAAQAAAKSAPTLPAPKAAVAGALAAPTSSSTAAARPRALSLVRPASAAAVQTIPHSGDRTT